MSVYGPEGIWERPAKFICVHDMIKPGAKSCNRPASIIDTRRSGYAFCPKHARKDIGTPEVDAK